jgi:hypothetical protein
MSGYDIGRRRAERQLAWGAEREERVLAGVLDACDRRAGRRRTALWATAAVLAALLTRTLPRAGFAFGGAASTPPGGVSAPDRTATGSTASADGGEKQGGLGGLAGSGGSSSRVRGVIAGSGGNAGTS